MGSLSFLQWIFLTQELNWGLLHCRRILYQLSYQGSPTTIISRSRNNPRVFQGTKIFPDKCYLPLLTPILMFKSWVRKIHWRKDRLPTPVFLGFPCGSAGKESARNVGDLGWEDPWRRERLSTPVFWPGEFQGHIESNMTE